MVKVYHVNKNYNQVLSSFTLQPLGDNKGWMRDDWALRTVYQNNYFISVRYGTQSYPVTIGS